MHPSIAGRVAAATTHSQKLERSIRQRLRYRRDPRDADTSTVRLRSTTEDLDARERRIDVRLRLGSPGLVAREGLLGGHRCGDIRRKARRRREVLDASQRTQENRSPFALFGANYRDNPLADEGDLHSLTATFGLTRATSRDPSPIADGAASRCRGGRRRPGR